MRLRDFGSDDGLSVRISELLVATAEISDPLIDDSIPEVLRAMRERMGMDVVFVSEFVDGRRMFRFVDAVADAPRIEAGDSSPAEESVCQRVVEGRVPEMVADLSALPKDRLPALPFRVGAHLSTPIVLRDKRVYGTLCCFSADARPDLLQADLDKLRMCATLVARKVEMGEKRGVREPPPDWKLEPQDEYESALWMRGPRGQLR